MVVAKAGEEAPNVNGDSKGAAVDRLNANVDAAKVLLDALDASNVGDDANAATYSE